MIDIDTSWEWIAMYGPVKYSTVQYSTVYYITTVIIDNIGHGHRSQVTVTAVKNVLIKAVVGDLQRNIRVRKKVRNIRFVWLLS